jgi:phage-related protein
MSDMAHGGRSTRRRWRDYETAAGRRPVRDFLAELTDDEVADIVAAMKEVAAEGLSAARHIEGDIYEVRATSDRQAFRILFAKEGQRGQVLLALEGFSKKQQKLPKRHLDLAKRRLADWRRRARG